MRYEVAEHTADIMVICRGDTVEECFGNAAYALFDQMADLSAVDRRVTVDVDVAGDDAESRLYAFLSELLFIRECESLLLSDFNVRFEDGHVICRASGEHADREKHIMRADVKAITYHMLSVNEKEPSVTVIFDV